MGQSSEAANYSEWLLILSHSDAFTRREKGNEDYYIRMHEKEKLDAVKQKMDEAQKHIGDLKAHMYVNPVPPLRHVVHLGQRRICE